VTCRLCEKGFPLEGREHYGTQALGMIPTTTCEDACPCGATENIAHRIDCRQGDPVPPQKRVVFLQNAWGTPGRMDDQFDRASWFWGLAGSRSGQRLVRLLGHGSWEDCWNTTPVVTRTPDGQAPAEVAYMRRILLRLEPGVVVACGLQAERAVLGLWRGPLLVVPHPTCRVLTNALYERGRVLLESGLTDRLALRQKRGRVEVERLAVPQAKGWKR
jgi:hypothetical protein